MIKRSASNTKQGRLVERPIDADAGAGVQMPPRFAARFWHPAHAIASAHPSTIHHNKSRPKSWRAGVVVAGNPNPVIVGHKVSDQGSIMREQCGGAFIAMEAIAEGKTRALPRFRADHVRAWPKLPWCHRAEKNWRDLAKDDIFSRCKSATSSAFCAGQNSAPDRSGTKLWPPNSKV